MTEGPRAALGPRQDGHDGIIGRVVDVADLGVALRVGRGHGAGDGGGGAGEGGGRVGVEDDLVGVGDPVVVVEDDGVGLVPRGLVLAALVRARGRDDVAAEAVRHDGAVVVPAVGAAAAGGGAVALVGRGRLRGPGVTAAHGEDVVEGDGALGRRGAGGRGAVAVEVGVDGRAVLDGAVLLGDDLGEGELLRAERVDGGGALGVAEGRGVVVGAVVAPAFVVVGCSDHLLGEDDVRVEGDKYRQQEVTVK